LAIADLAGAPWPERLRAALVELFAPEAEEYRNSGTQLLADIRDIFEEQGVERIEPKKLIEELCNRRAPGRITGMANH
jgi:hypothetical protein